MLTADSFSDVRYEMDTLAAQARNGACKTARHRELCLAKLARLEAWWERTAPERERIGWTPKAPAKPKAVTKRRVPPQWPRKPAHKKTIPQAVVEALRAAQRPMKADEIMEALAAEGIKPSTRDSLTSSIAANLRGVVRRVSPPLAPGVYALCEGAP